MSERETLGSVIVRGSPPMLARRPSLGVIFLTVLIDLLGFGIVMPFLAIEAREAFGVSSTTATLLGTCYSGAQFLFMPLWGRLSDRVGRRPVMLTSILFSALGMLALGSSIAWGSSILWVFLARTASGVATANIGTASAYIADITKPEDRAKGMGMIGMAFGFGFLLGPGVGGLLKDFPINGREGPVACFVAAGLSAINLLWAYFGLPESLPRERRNSFDQRPRSPLRFVSLRRTLQRPGVGRAVVTNHLVILAFSGLEMTYSLYAVDAFGFDKGGIAMMFVFMGLVGALVQGGIVRRLSGKVRETSMLLAGLSLLTLGFFGFVVAPSFGRPALWAVSAMIAIGNGLTQPAVSAYVSRLTDANLQGETLSASQSMSSLGRTFGPLLAGLLYGLSPRTPFVGCLVLNAAAIAIASGMRRFQPEKPTGQPALGLH